MKTFKDLVKGDKIYYSYSNKEIATFIFEGFSPFDAPWGKTYDLIISDPTGRYVFGPWLVLDKTALNFTHFLNYYSCLESLALDIINGDV